MINNDTIIAVAAIVLIAAIIVGFIRKFKNGDTIDSIISDTVVDEVKDVVGGEIADVLHNAGIATDYESFKDHVIKSLLKKAREYFDKKGGTIDEVTDAISDDAIINAINMVIGMSDIESEIKDAYDQLINNRLKEIDESENEVESENDAIENEDLSKYEDGTEDETEEADPEVTVDEE